jgi:hypothetical protein
MAKNAATHPSSAPSSASQPADSRPALAPVIEINVRHIGRTPQREKLTGSEAPEGWIKRIDRPREGEVWVGFFHLYVADPSGRAVRKKKEKTLGPATMPKHEAQQKLADYIEEWQSGHSKYLLSFSVAPLTLSGAESTKRHSYSVSGSRFRMLPANMFAAV